MDGKTFRRCHSERSEESRSDLFVLASSRTRARFFASLRMTARFQRTEESQSATSRLSVAISNPQASVRFAQTGLFWLLLRSDLCKYALKTRIICTIQKGDFLCFQVLLSFVPTLFVFLRNSFFPQSPGPFHSLERLGSPGARLRQTVPNSTTVIGYHKAGGLSSEKCETTAGWRTRRNRRRPRQPATHENFRQARAEEV
jgi:hypothetical protein